MGKTKDRICACLVEGSADGYEKEKWVPLDGEDLDVFHATFFAIREDRPGVKAFGALNTLKKWARSETADGAKTPHKGHDNTKWHFKAVDLDAGLDPSDAMSPPPGTPSRPVHESSAVSTDSTPGAGAKRSLPSSFRSPGPGVPKRPAGIISALQSSSGVGSSSAASPMTQTEGGAVPPLTPKAHPGTSAAENAAEFPWRRVSSTSTATDIHAAEAAWYSQCQAEMPLSRPSVLIVANPLPEAHANHLKEVEAEAQGIQAAYGGDAKAEVLLNTSVQNLDDDLFGREVCYFAGHGDLPLERQKVPAFVKNGQIESVSIETIVRLVRPHAKHGQLRLFVFTGCCTHDLAKALHKAGVTCVVCWKSVLYDPAGKVFGEAFAEAHAAATTGPATAAAAARPAYEAACTAVLKETELKTLPNGLQVAVQKYDITADPKDSVMVWPNNGRLKSGGRMAAGVPCLLDEGRPLKAEMPLGARAKLEDCPSRETRGEDLKKLVDALATGSVCIKGRGKVGKTVLSAAVLADSGVSKQFKDGMFWLDVGQAGSERADQLLAGVVRELHQLLRNRRLPVAEALPATIENPVAQLWQWISMHKLSCLLVLDDVWTETFVELELECTGLTLLINTGKDDIADKMKAKLKSEDHLIEVDCVNPLLTPKALFARFMRNKEPSDTSLFEEIKTKGESILDEKSAGILDVAQMLRVEFHRIVLKGFGSFNEQVEYAFVDDESKASRGFVLLKGERTHDSQTASAMQSNGTGKTTLLAAVLWALTGQLDMRADGKDHRPTKGIINEAVRASASGKASVTLTGTRQEGNGGTKQTFKIVRTVSMDIRDPVLELHLGPSLTDLTKVSGKKLKELQTEIDDKLRLRVSKGAKMMLERTCYFSQHLSNGLLELTGKEFKAEFDSLMPGASTGKSLWSEAENCASERHKDATRELTAARELRAVAQDRVGRLQDQLKEEEQEAEKWQERQKEKLRQREMVLEEKRKLLGAAEQEQEVPESGGSPAGQPCSSQDQLNAAREEQKQATSRRDECDRKIRELSNADNDVEVKEAQKALATAEQEVNLSHEELKALRAKKAALESTPVSHDERPASSWSEARTNDAQQVLQAAAGSPIMVLDLSPLRAAVDAARAKCGAADERFKETGGTEGECPSCGQDVTEEHLCKLKQCRKAAQIAASNALESAEDALQDAMRKVDARALQDLQAERKGLDQKEGELEAKHTTACERKNKVLTALSQAKESVEHRVRDEDEKLKKLKADEAEKQEKLHQMELAAQRQLLLQHKLNDARGAFEEARKFYDECSNEPNPHKTRSQGKETELQTAKKMLNQHVKDCDDAERRKTCYSELKQHFGPMGVPMMLYQHMIRQLEAMAAKYIRSVSDGELELRLAFSSDFKQVDSKVLVRGTERPTLLLSGGEWRRVGLGLSLAFAEFAQERMNLSCNLMVLDEAMQHMDLKGRAVAVRSLKEMQDQRDTMIVIEHGLVEEHEFDRVDVVKRGKETTRVEQARPKPVEQAAEAGPDAVGPSRTSAKSGKRPADAAPADTPTDKQAKTSPDNAPAPAAPATQALASAASSLPPIEEQHAFCDAARKRDFAKVTSMLEAQPTLVNVQPSQRWSALHQFAQAGHEEAVKFLLARNADRGAKTKEGMTPLQVAHASVRDLLR